MYFSCTVATSDLGVNEYTFHIKLDIISICSRINVGKEEMFSFLQLTFQNLRSPTTGPPTSVEGCAISRDKNGKHFLCEFSNAGFAFVSHSEDTNSLTHFPSPDIAMTLVSRNLKDGWKFTQIGGGDVIKEGEWLDVHEFPTTVHVELLKHKRIPDPVRTII